MAKRSVVARQKRREQLQERYRAKWARLKEAEAAAIQQGKIPWEIYRAFQQLPRNSNRVRLKRRCRLCGRARATFRRFQVCRLCLRVHAMRGNVAGMHKASW